jgi:hypothetical protein
VRRLAGSALNSHALDAADDAMALDVAGAALTLISSPFSYPLKIDITQHTPHTPIQEHAPQHVNNSASKKRANNPR